MALMMSGSSKASSRSLSLLSTGMMEARTTLSSF